MFLGSAFTNDGDVHVASALGMSANAGQVERKTGIPMRPNVTFFKSRVRTRVTVSLIATLAVALLLSLAFTAHALATFRVANVAGTVSTRQAAAHPTFGASFSRYGTSAEDLAGVKIQMPPGLVFNPASVAAPCNNTQFSDDACPASSVVGTARAVVAMDSFFLSRKTVYGTIYVVEPSPGSAATFGIVLRPSNMSKGFIRQQISMSSTNASVTATITGMLTHFGSTPITFASLSLTYNYRSGAQKSGGYFVLNSSSCATAAGSITATSTGGATSGNGFNYLPTGCQASVVETSFGVAYRPNDALRPAGPEFSFDLPTNDATIQASTIRSASVTLQPGAGIDSASLDGVTRCARSDLLAGACPSSSRVGLATATLPYFPPAWSGDVYLLEPDVDQLPIGIELKGARGMRIVLSGATSMAGSGGASAMRLTLAAMPSIPIERLGVSFDVLKVRLPNDCDPRSATAQAIGHSGATVSKSVPTQVENCLAPPDTSIASAPPSPTNDNTPSFSFSAAPAADTYECSVDGGPWLECNPDFVLLPGLPDGEHVLRVRAVNAAGADPTPAEYDFTIDTLPPDFTVAVEVIGSSLRVIIGGSSPEDAYDCRLDDGPWTPCSTGFVFVLVPDGSHVVCVRGTDPAGNSQTECVYVIWEPPPPLDPVIVAGPRGGLAITDRTPTFEFVGDEIPGFECSIDAGAWVGCASPYTLDPVTDGMHVFQVRDASYTSAVSPPAHFQVGDFAPSVAVTPSTYQAAAHPDLSVDLASPAGDVVSTEVALPDGMWLAPSAAVLCSESDVAGFTCGADSRVGSISIDAVDDLNQPFTMSGDVYAAEAPGGSHLGRLAFSISAQPGGSDMGRYAAIAEVDARRGTGLGPPDLSNPQGAKLSFTNLPSSTATNPGADGFTPVHIRSLTVELDGIGPAQTEAVVTNPSNCDPLIVLASSLDSEGASAMQQDDAQFVNCAAVPFDPSVHFSPSASAPGAGVAADFGASFPADNSSLKFVVFKMPVGLQTHFAGFGNTCPTADVLVSPPACDDATTRAGTIQVESPLFPQALTGPVYLEDNGGVFPALHAYISEPSLGVEWRLRSSYFPSNEPVSRLEVTMAVEQTNEPSTISDLPVSDLTMSLPGTSTNGPIFRLSTLCSKTTTFDAELHSWSGATVNRSTPVSFPPSCPN